MIVMSFFENFQFDKNEIKDTLSVGFEQDKE